MHNGIHQIKTKSTRGFAVAIAAWAATTAGCSSHRQLSLMEPQFQIPTDAARPIKSSAIGMYSHNSAYIASAGDKINVLFYKQINENPFAKNIDFFNGNFSNLYDLGAVSYVPHRDAVFLISANDTFEHSQAEVFSLGPAAIRNVASVDSVLKNPKVSPGKTALVATNSPTTDELLFWHITESLHPKFIGAVSTNSSRLQSAWIGAETFLTIESGRLLRSCSIKNNVIEDGEEVRLADGFYTLPQFQPLDGRRIILKASSDVNARSAVNAQQEVVLYSADGSDVVIGLIPVNAQSAFWAEKNALVAIGPDGGGYRWTPQKWSRFQLNGSPPFTIGTVVSESGVCNGFVVVDSKHNGWIVE